MVEHGGNVLLFQGVDSLAMRPYLFSATACRRQQSYFSVTVIKTLVK
jgi:hypothetical protein